MEISTIKIGNPNLYSGTKKGVQSQDDGKVLDLLTEQVRYSSQAIGILNELLLADKNISVCTVSEYDAAKEKLRSNLSSIMEIEKELARFEVIGK